MIVRRLSRIEISYWRLEELCEYFSLLLSITNDHFGEGEKSALDSA
jgi:hypothetical protein